MKSKWRKIPYYCDHFINKKIRPFGIPLLRISLGIVFFWFGLLKLLHRTPVESLIQEVYSFVPLHPMLIVLGIWECLIGICLIFKIFIRTTILFLWIHMMGVFSSLFLAPRIFCKDNFFCLTLEGEFVIKNVVIIAASIVILSYQHSKLKRA